MPYSEDEEEEGGSEEDSDNDVGLDYLTKDIGSVSVMYL